jgi:hypothetical protein
MGVKPEQVLQTECPECGARPGQRCVRTDATSQPVVRLQFHQRRVQAAGIRRSA